MSMKKLQYNSLSREGYSLPFPKKIPTKFFTPLAILPPIYNAKDLTNLISNY